MLGHILLNLFLSDVFLILNDIKISCYGDDNTLYKACGNVHAIVKTLRMSAEKLFKWFKDNQMEGNTDKYHLILSAGDSI